MEETPIKTWTTLHNYTVYLPSLFFLWSFMMFQRQKGVLQQESVGIAREIRFSSRVIVCNSSLCSFSLSLRLGRGVVGWSDWGSSCTQICCIPQYQKHSPTFMSISSLANYGSTIPISPPLGRSTGKLRNSKPWTLSMKYKEVVVKTAYSIPNYYLLGIQFARASFVKVRS